MGRPTTRLSEEHARAARRWLGLLQGGEEGRRAVREHEGAMREQLVRHCGRLTALYFPAAVAQE